MGYEMRWARKWNVKCWRNTINIISIHLNSFQLNSIRLELGMGICLTIARQLLYIYVCALWCCWLANIYNTESHINWLNADWYVLGYWPIDIQSSYIVKSKPQICSFSIWNCERNSIYFHLQKEKYVYSLIITRWGSFQGLQNWLDIK